MPVQLFYLALRNTESTVSYANFGQLTKAELRNNHTGRWQLSRTLRKVIGWETKYNLLFINIDQKTKDSRSSKRKEDFGFNFIFFSSIRCIMLPVIDFQVKTGIKHVNLKRKLSDISLSLWFLINRFCHEFWSN